MFKRKKKTAPATNSEAHVNESVLDSTHIKSDVLNQYLTRLRKMRPELVVQGVIGQYRFVSFVYTVSLALFIAGMLIIWQKNLAVDVVYQRIDGASIKIPNDPRSRVLLTKVLQDAKVIDPAKSYNLQDDEL